MRLSVIYETYNQYDIIILQDLNNIHILEEKTLAFAVDINNFKIIISRSGHGKLKRMFGDDLEGGWIFPKNRKISWHSGTLGWVTDKDNVKKAIERKLGIYLREAS